MTASEKGGVSPEPSRVQGDRGARSKLCGNCGAEFLCGAADGACWCDSVKLDAAVLVELRAKFADCLCPECLTGRAREKSPS